MFKITIEKLSPPSSHDQRRYAEETIYQQTVEELDVAAIIEAVNKKKPILPI